MLSILRTRTTTSRQLSRFLDKAQYYKHSQNILDKFYLQPIAVGSNGSRLTKQHYTKTNVRDGHIEREIHGAMHVSRVSIYVEILHRMMKQQFPDYANEVMRALEPALGMDEQSILVLTRYAALCHDAARLGEGSDQWEAQSGDVVRKLFEDNDVDAQTAQMISLLVVYKDHAGKLNEACSSLTFSENAKSSFHYLRRLISMADCFDIIRCTGEFKFSYIEKLLSDIPGFDQATHSSVFFEFARQVYALLKDQHDLYFNTELIGPNKESYKLPEASLDFSLAHKVKFEHAENVVSAMVVNMQQYPYFSNYLTDETHEVLAETQLSNLRALVSPFLHGTSSSALALLAYTDFILQSPLDLLEHHLRAPITGELTGGGLKTISSRCNPCFARLKGEPNTNEYTLESVIKYASPQAIPSLKDTCDSLNSELDYGKRYNPLYSNINLILIFAARYRQLGGDLSEVPKLQSLGAFINAAKGIYYLYLIIAHHFEPLKTLNDEARKRLGDAFYKKFSTPVLINKIQESGLDFEGIYNLPTESKLQAVLTFLQLPVASPDEDPLMLTQAFQIKSQLSDARSTTQDTNITRSDWRKSPNEVMECFITPHFSAWHFIHPSTTNQIIQHINLLEERFQICQRMLDNPVDTIQFDLPEKAFLDEPFPLILIYDKEVDMQIIRFNSQEYRANRALTLGEDIRIVATDNVIHQQQLKDYFAIRQRNIEVILIRDLYEARLHMFKIPMEKPNAANDEQSISVSCYPTFFSTQPASTLTQAGRVDVNTSSLTAFEMTWGVKY